MTAASRSDRDLLVGDADAEVVDPVPVEVACCQRCTEPIGLLADADYTCYVLMPELIAVRRQAEPRAVQHVHRAARTVTSRAAPRPPGHPSRRRRSPRSPGRSRMPRTCHRHLSTPASRTPGLSWLHSWLPIPVSPAANPNRTLANPGLNSAKGRRVHRASQPRGRCSRRHRTSPTANTTLIGQPWTPATPGLAADKMCASEVSPERLHGARRVPRVHHQERSAEEPRSRGQRTRRGQNRRLTKRVRSLRRRH